MRATYGSSQTMGKETPGKSNSTDSSSYTVLISIPDGYVTTLVWWTLLLVISPPRRRPIILTLLSLDLALLPHQPQLAVLRPLVVD
jgi:hypothetical protein